MNLYSDHEIDSYISREGLKEEEYTIIDNLNRCNESLLNYEKKIFVRKISPAKHASNINTRLLLDYLRMHGYDVELFLERYGRKLGDVLNDYYEWVPLDYHIEFLDHFQEFINEKNPRSFEKFGVIANEEDQTVTRFIDLMTKLVSLQTIFESVPLFNRSYDNDLTFQYVETVREDNILKVTLLFRSFDNFKENILFRTQFWSLGLLTALPRRRGYRRAAGRALYYGYSLIQLLKRDYAYLNLNVEEREDGIYIDGKRYAKPVLLPRERKRCTYSAFHRLHIFFSSIKKGGEKALYRDIFQASPIEEEEAPVNSGAGRAYRIIEDLYDDEEVPVLIKGELFDLPYSRFEIEIDLSSYDKSYRKGLKEDYRTLNIHLSRMRAQIYELERANRLAAEKSLEAEEARRELEELNLSLEDKIEERTRELQEANKRLKESNERLEKAMAELTMTKDEIEELSRQRVDSFINFAHEAKTPLTLIVNYLEDYLEKRKSGSYDQELMVVKKNIDKLERDMINFLDNEKLLRGESGYNKPTIIDFSRLLNDSVTLFRESARKKHVQIVPWIAENIFILASETALDRMVNNLLDNAVKYIIDKEGTVKVGLTTERDRVIFTVEDNGIGIARNQLKTIFKPYHQISNKKNSFQGIGMGLSIVHKIVELLDGTIKVESRLGEGSTFRIELKRYFPQRWELSGIKREFTLSRVIDYSRPQLEKESGEDESELPLILIVEDSLDIVQYYKEKFRGHYRIRYALGAREGLDMLDVDNKPQVILLDLMMDDMDGYAFLEELNEKPRFNDIPVICITAKSGENEKLKALKAGSVDFITKPFRFDEVMARIDALIRTRENLYRADLAIIFQENCRRLEFSPKELEIATHLINGMESKEIASVLGKALSTVNNQLSKMFEKAGVRTRGELMIVLKTPPPKK